MAGAVFIRVKVEGTSALTAKLGLVGNVVRLGVGYATYNMARTIKSTARAVVPVVKGDLQRGIEATKLGVYDWVVTASSIAGGADREYAPYVEHGTYKMAARPFMAPGVEAGRRAALENLAAVAASIERL